MPQKAPFENCAEAEAFYEAYLNRNPSVDAARQDIVQATLAATYLRMFCGYEYPFVRSRGGIAEDVSLPSDLNGVPIVIQE